MKADTNKNTAREGAILGVVMIVMIFLSVLVMSLFHDGFFSAREAEVELKSTQAFWLAEAGRQAASADLYEGNGGILPPTRAGNSVPGGTYEVIQDPGNPQARIAIGRVTVAGETIERRVRIGLAYVAGPFEKAIYAGNDNGEEYTLQLRGKGNDEPPVPVRNQHIFGGKDSILGDLEVRGDLLMQENSYIRKPTPNRYGILGDVETTGTITTEPGTVISGSRTEGASGTAPPELSEMQYASDNDYDIARIFNDAGVVSGRLPNGHPLENVLNVVKNPADRSAENDSTVGDDFYFEPQNPVAHLGTPDTAKTPLPLGDDKVYYVDGHVWFHSKSTYGFEVDGRAAIVASRDIHISDNVAYKDRGVGGDLLALVALGQYTGDARNGYGDIYFGDPRYGTLYTMDAFMFANNNFYYNTDSVDGKNAEPESGFKIFGNFMAVNQVVVYRDWYEDSDGDYRAAEYDPATGTWVDALYANDDIDGNEYELTSTEISGIRHYAMQVHYDDRIQNASTQMRGLPRGIGTIFAGVVSWEEIPPPSL